jgi:hypothetical protein
LPETLRANALAGWREPLSDTQLLSVDWVKRFRRPSRVLFLVIPANAGMTARESPVTDRNLV